MYEGLIKNEKIVGHLIVLSLLCLINVNPARAWDAERRQPQSYELQQNIFIHSGKMPALFIQRGMIVSLFWGQSDHCIGFYRQI